MIIFVLLFVQFLLADNTGIPIGDKELFTANTGIAQSRSAGAVFYNPAAMSTVQKSKVSVTASDYLKVTFKGRPSGVFDNTPFNSDLEAVQAIPVSLITVYNRRSSWYGFSILTPSALAFQGVYDLASTGALRARGVLTISERSQDFYIGPSFSRKIVNKWYWGTSAYFNIFNKVKAESSLIQLDVLPTLTLSTIKNADIDFYGYTQIFGIYYDGDDVDFGIRIRMPLYELKSGARYYKKDLVNSSGTITPTTVSLKSTDVNRKNNSSFGFGLAHEATSDVKLLLDLSYKLGDSYAEIPVDSSAPREETDDQISSNFGLEYDFSNKWKLGSGIYLIDVFGNNTINKSFGYTVGLNYIDGVFQNGVGFFYNRTNNEKSIENTSIKAKEEVNLYGIIISSSYNFE